MNHQKSEIIIPKNTSLELTLNPHSTSGSGFDFQTATEDNIIQIEQIEDDHHKKYSKRIGKNYKQTIKITAKNKGIAYLNEIRPWNRSHIITQIKITVV